MHVVDIELIKHCLVIVQCSKGAETYSQKEGKDCKAMLRLAMRHTRTHGAAESVKCSRSGFPLPSLLRLTHPSPPSLAARQVSPVSLTSPKCFAARHEHIVSDPIQCSSVLVT